jgi:hypothetical protein
VTPAAELARQQRRLVVGVVISILMSALLGGRAGAALAREQAEQAVITPENVGSFSPDALTLAAGLTHEPWLSAETAALLDADLLQIRARFPQVHDVHARPDVVLTNLIIALDFDAPWFDSWKSESLATGDPAVDTLQQTFHAIKLTSGYGLDMADPNHYHTFLLTFAQPLNIRAIVPLFAVASGHFRHVQPNYLYGDGDRITFEQMGESKRYVFSKGGGDCPAGCTQRHFWEFTLLSGGEIRLSEYGDPVPSPLRYEPATDTWRADGNLLMAVFAVPHEISTQADVIKES